MLDTINPEYEKSTWAKALPRTLTHEILPMPVFQYLTCSLWVCGTILRIVHGSAALAAGFWFCHAMIMAATPFHYVQVSYGRFLIDMLVSVVYFPAYFLHALASLGWSLPVTASVAFGLAYFLQRSRGTFLRDDTIKQLILTAVLIYEGSSRHESLLWAGIFFTCVCMVYISLDCAHYFLAEFRLYHTVHPEMPVFGCAFRERRCMPLQYHES